MSRTPSPELLTEAAGVRIFMTPLREDAQYPQTDSSVTGKVVVTLESGDARKASGRTCGFHLTKSKWDPYPWVSYVETASPADNAGLRSGDCLIQVDGRDLLGLKVKEVATLINRNNQDTVKLSLWRQTEEKCEQEQVGLALKGPLPDVAGRLVNAVSGAVRALECPVCLESSMPPVSQCVHGHIICFGCRPKTSRCPVCRVRLGQGRCLLADKLHRVFRDIFGAKDDSRSGEDAEALSLRERLFGKSKKKRGMQLAIKQTDAAPKPRRLLLTRLFLGGLEKAASADNLTTANESSATDGATSTNQNLHVRLNLHDRVKSASTGELSREAGKEINNVSLENDKGNSVVSSTASLMSSAPQTPTWGGSMDSMSSVQIVCPLSRQGHCRDIVTPGSLLEHLNRAHGVPQVHFYSGSARVPLPLPFGADAIYVLHHAGDVFFFQCEQETAWMSCTAGGNNSWEWAMHGLGKNGAELRLRKYVASLEQPFVLSVDHVAPLPHALSLDTLNIQLFESRSCDKVNI